MKIDFPASVYNDVMARMRRAKPLRGVHCKIVETEGGMLIAGNPPPPKWKHPWTLTPFWQTDAADPSGGSWQVIVTPGFVNAADVMVYVANAPVAIAETPAPALKITNWRNPLGVRDDGSVEGYPPYFKKLGVKASETPAVGADGETPVVTEPVTPEVFGTRRIMAADVILTCDHAGVASDVMVADPLTGNAVIQSAVLTLPTTRWPYRVSSAPRFAPAQYPDMLDRLMGSLTEPDYDNLCLGTLWMVSPPDEPDETFPDSTWQAYPQHFVFWNLAYENQRLLSGRPPDPITINTGLAGGLLDTIGNAILSQLNDAYAAALRALNPTSMRGYFRTL